MNWGSILFRLGALGLFLTLGVFWDAPLVQDLQNGTTQWPVLIILFGFAVIAGLILLLIPSSLFRTQSRTLMYVTHGLCLLSILWLLLWCFVWLALIASRGDNAEMLIKHIADLHLFGVGFTMAAYGAGWISSRLDERSVRFAMGVGWAISYMAWLNLYLQPGLTWLWAPGVGGFLLVLGAYLMTRSLNRSAKA